MQQQVKGNGSVCHIFFSDHNLLHSVELHFKLSCPGKGSWFETACHGSSYPGSMR